MNLIFEQTANRHQCGCEILVNDFLMQCTFSSSKTVTIPAGVQFSGRKIGAKHKRNGNDFTKSAPNHEKRLRNAFDEFTSEGV